ncbi:hypothetical protein VNI00_001610 [Paramarasmius palmivorus]|uniref:Uncharacterized protein n=1 Tax=Paramarasmius palmivorus TaxID=297713 RepID=A0AAW0E4M2_9AGAR
MQQSYAAPYYSQNAYYPSQMPYDGAGPNNNFTPYWATAPHHQYHSTPYFPGQASQQQQQQQQQQPHQPYTLDKPGRPFRPFKSSLKRHETLPAPQPNQPVRRKRATSNPQQPKMEAPETPAETPSRMFISFVGTDEIQIEHLSKVAMAEIRTTIFQKEWPYGTVLDELKDLVWRVKFNNAPWCVSGPGTEKAWDMLLSLFTRFSQRGYSFHTSISIGSSAPRLIFLASELDMTSRFFFAHPANGGRKLTFYKPPTEIRQHLPGMLLRTTLSGHIDIDVPEEGGSFSIELKKGLYTSRTISSSHLLVIILRSLESFDVQLETAIPLARKGPLSKLGMGPRPELLLFKVFAKHA